MLRIPAKGTCPEQIHLCHFSLVNLNLAFAKPITIKLGVSFTKISRHPSHKHHINNISFYKGQNQEQIL